MSAGKPKAGPEYCTNKPRSGYGVSHVIAISTTCPRCETSVTWSHASPYSPLIEPLMGDGIQTPAGSYLLHHWTPPITSTAARHAQATQMNCLLGSLYSAGRPPLPDRESSRGVSCSMGARKPMITPPAVTSTARDMKAIICSVPIGMKKRRSNDVIRTHPDIAKKVFATPRQTMTRCPFRRPTSTIPPRLSSSKLVLREPGATPGSAGRTPALPLFTARQTARMMSQSTNAAEASASEIQIVRSHKSRNSEF